MDAPDKPGHDKGYGHHSKGDGYSCGHLKQKNVITRLIRVIHALF
jgi:hypothetical protein